MEIALVFLYLMLVMLLGFSIVIYQVHRLQTRVDILTRAMHRSNVRTGVVKPPLAFKEQA